MTDTGEIHTIDSELQDIRLRDARSAVTWFKQPALGACGRAFIDRRFLLYLLDIILEGLNMANETVDSASDRRVVNNILRHEYRVLSDDEKVLMQGVKDQGASLIGTLRLMSDTADPMKMTWELQNAHRAAEEAVMWAVKHITR